MNVINFLPRINWFFVILLLLISSIGVALLYSIAGASWDPWALNQIIRILISLVVLILISLVNIGFWYKLANPLYLFSIFLIFLTFFLGKEVSGATRWIDLYFFSFQPAEITKIFVILALAKYFHSIKLQSYDIKQRIFFPLLILFIPVLLIFKQPDLGTALIIFFSGIIVLFLSGVQIKTFVLSGIGSLILLPIFWAFLEDYQKSRFINFLDQQSNTLGANYHITQSKIALGSGGFFGKGFLEGTQSHLNFIPEMETDFIFSVLGDPDLNVEKRIIKDQVEEDVRKLIDELPEDQRDVLVMRIYKDMSFKEIAERTDVSINTALGRMRYALINLRKLIDEHNIVLTN